ncbi:hypothetical protein CFC21_039596 [Triticum aestivum]|uniref:Uncharacterized protein n=3 Tax=Triticum TaxID=4564 RepID=A0A9R1RX15_TRITD|nr:hypothetical protein CFC21_039596 [Triticum aestivum]VAH72088.1 unnamed protein product [Triticum turgidum subsp. durum]
MAIEDHPPEPTRIPAEEWKQTANEFTSCVWESKFHRFPASLRDLGERYIEPMVVAIGPYHHGIPKLEEMEKLKMVAAHCFIEDSGHSPEEIYGAVSAVAGMARGLYVGDEVADPSLQRALICNRVCIENDIMLLENQIPWSVVDILNGLSGAPAPVDKFISIMGSMFQIGQRGSVGIGSFLTLLSTGCNPPHLLALFRMEKVGPVHRSYVELPSTLPFTIRATDLARMSIRIKPCMTPYFCDMGIWIAKIFSYLFLPPLFLDETRACWLVNMAALEVCTASNDREDIRKLHTAVCSYLALLAMLMNREEDVEELHKKQILQANLTDKETLDFFKNLVKRLDGGPVYNSIVAEIQQYKETTSWIKVYGFIQDNTKIILTMLPIIGFLAGILRTLLSLNSRQQYN